MVDVELIQQAMQMILPLGICQWKGFQDGQNILLNAHPAKDRGLLRKVSDSLLGSLMHGPLRNLGVIQENLPAIGSHQSNDHIKRSRLTGTIGPQKSHYLAGLDFKADAADYLAPFIAFVNLNCLKPTVGFGLWAVAAVVVVVLC